MSAAMGLPKPWTNWGRSSGVGKTFGNYKRELQARGKMRVWVPRTKLWTRQSQGKKLETSDRKLSIDCDIRSRRENAMPSVPDAQVHRVTESKPENSILRRQDTS